MARPPKENKSEELEVKSQEMESAEQKSEQELDLELLEGQEMESAEPEKVKAKQVSYSMRNKFGEKASIDVECEPDEVILIIPDSMTFPQAKRLAFWLAKHLFKAFKK